MTIILRYVTFFFIVLILLPALADASRVYDAEAVVTMRDGLPCFSYPQDEVIRMRPFSFAYLSVSEAGPVGSGGWEAQIKDAYRKGLLEPNSPKTCIKYGGPHPGVQDYFDPAKPLLPDTPYRAFIRVTTPRGALYERKFCSKFCISQDKKGNKIIVGAIFNDHELQWKCLKPGEKPPISLWQRLFGK